MPVISLRLQLGLHFSQKQKHRLGLNFGGESSAATSKEVAKASTKTKRQNLGQNQQAVIVEEPGQRETSKVLGLVMLEKLKKAEEKSSRRSWSKKFDR